MTDIILILLFIIFFIIYYLIIPYQVKRRRTFFKKSSFCPHWHHFLEKNIYLYRILPNNLKLELQDYIKVFLAEKEFIGQDGFIITIYTKLAIASQACILLLGDKENRRNYFPYLKYIYVYPQMIIENKNKKENPIILLGLSSVGDKSGYDGVVYLSWAEIAEKSPYPSKGENVILHEFAHQLDQEFGNATGMPRLKNLQESLMWGEIFGKEYYNHCQAVKNQQPTVIDAYGAISSAEFFAVVTEAFFLNSRLLQANHPLLYDQVSKFYGVDPIQWIINYEL
ncbi:zinc-dependent peptidase [Geminocystis sp. GBBB08]|uniref:M90 family metallopeptidase n=1 Tax=Geminocystis sp. GBBB08 TaxID=2604140 RepID=UPI0027E315E0|nr:zinc-dependent peptidase [Geminocystis sp. GBBB08]MBL1209065.1 zinc-dependent peptidase [Geminocystis sp. GBBB08]